MKNINKTLLIIILVIGFCYSCKTEKITTVAVASPENTTTIYFIRHAEDSTNDKQDPNLSEQGKLRAKKYLTYFQDIKFNAVYSTNFNRTKQTATPLATKNNLEMVIYNPFEIDRVAFFKKHVKETLILVGHSNTTPDLTNKFLGKMKYSQMLDNNYSDIYKVIIYEDGTIEDELIKYD